MFLKTLRLKAEHSEFERCNRASVHNPHHRPVFIYPGVHEEADK